MRFAIQGFLAPLTVRVQQPPLDVSLEMMKRTELPLQPSPGP